METEKIIILKRIQHGDSDLIIYGLTPVGAKIGFFARAARKSKRRFGGGVLEPTHYVKVQYTKARREDGLAQLRDGILVEAFPGIRSEYDRLNMALHFVSIIEKISQEGDVHSSSLFNLLGNGLRAAETSSQLELLRLHFQTKLLAAQGVLPNLPHVNELLKAPISHHEDVIIPEEVLAKLRREIDQELSVYLH